MRGSEPSLSGTELTRSPLSLSDELGTVFFRGEQVFRAVYPQAEATVRALLKGGLLDELAARGWIPPWKISAQSVEGSPLVLEQQRLPVVAFPFEWSYSMLLAAAQRVLEIGILAAESGWELKDCHGFNVVFDGPRPMYVDLGSFVPRPAGARDWIAEEEFLRAYWYPLIIWRDGGGFLARRLVATSELMSHADYGRYRWPWFRGRAGRLYQRWAEARLRWRRLSRAPEAKLRQLPAGVGNTLKHLRDARLLPGQGSRMERWLQQLEGQHQRNHEGQWSAYQEAADFLATPRFRRLQEIVTELAPRTLLELAGNQGVFAAHLLNAGVVQQALSTDADEWAVDRAYLRTVAARGALQTAVLDFVHPLATPFGEPVDERFRSDVVLALAVTHHLLLTQRVPVERVLGRVSAFAREAVVIEFMPLGLWNGRAAPPVPAWYRVEWFRAAFSREFELVREEQLEENRIAFVGRVRRRSS